MIGVSGTDTADAEAKKNFLLQIGAMSSALEHAVPEQMFTDPNDPTNAPEAISAVKALSKAQAAGQRIYHITSANQTTVLPNINHDSLTMNEIQAALAVGKEVITHTDAVSVPGWSGAGYIILDPVVGDGAYKISGGANGGFEETDTEISLMDLLIQPANAGDTNRAADNIRRMGPLMDAYDSLDRCSSWESALSYFISATLISILVGYPIMAFAKGSLLTLIVGAILVAILVTLIMNEVVQNNRGCR